MNRQSGTHDNALVCALYSRLSRDDEAAGDSLSIQNQKSMLESYAKQHGFTNFVHFSDDGFSGGNFERPDWKHMIVEIEKGNVSTVISKDMSRVGRDYLQTGFYTEVFFREKGVRFIAIANNIDTINKDSGEFAPFLNIMSEWYLRDASRKVKASHKARGMNGKRLTFNPIYGFILDSNDKSKWVIDPESAEVVRRIFSLTIEGNGPHRIARILYEDKIERPSYYQYSRGIVNYANNDHSNPYAWSSTSIQSLIARPEYCGDTVNFRTYKDSYKDKNSKFNDKEDWVIFKDTHPAIIDRSTWETAQRCRQTIRRIDTTGEANPLTGLVFCKDCGAKLYNHRAKPKTTRWQDGAWRKRPASDIYCCSTYSNTIKRFSRQCTQHQIRTAVLRELALHAISTTSNFVKNNEDEFLRLVRESSVVQRNETAQTHKKRIAKEQKRIAELDKLIRRTYEDNVSGKLTDKRFEVLSKEYEQEQAELEQSIERLQSELETFNTDSVKADRFIEIVKRHTNFTELTTPMIMEYIDKIIVHEADKSSGEREQQVDIYLNFIGKFDVPMPEPTPEEIEAEEKARLKRANQRERQLRYSERKREKRRLEREQFLLNQQQAASSQ